MKKLILIASLLAANSAYAETCAPRAQVVERLSGEYQETTLGNGLTSNGAIVELWASESGSWTIFATMPNGMSCLLAAGEFWETFAPAPLGEEM